MLQTTCAGLQQAREIMMPREIISPSSFDQLPDINGGGTVLSDGCF